MSFELPNYTQTPNALYAALPEMGDAELRVTLAICRKTFGWHKREDKISLSQLEELTGLSRQGVLNGIEDGLSRSTVGRAKSGNSYVYHLIFEDADKVVNEVDPSDEGSQRSRPGVVNEVDQQVVNEVDTQKKYFKQKREESTSPAQANTFVVDGVEVSASKTDPATGKAYGDLSEPEREQAAKGWPIGVGITDAADHQAVEMYNDMFLDYQPNDYQRGKIAMGVTEAVNEEQRRGKDRPTACKDVIAHWEEALDVWAGNRHKPWSVYKLMDRFENILNEARSQANASRSNGRARPQQSGNGGKRGRVV